MMSLVWTVLLVVFQPMGSLGSDQVLKGFHFQDNLIDKRFGPENGHATFNTGQPIPDQMSICFKINIEFDRYGVQYGLLELFRFNETVPSLSFVARDGYKLYLDGLSSKTVNQKYDLRSKWTSICTAFDFPGDRWELFLNGKEINGTIQKLRPLDGKMSDAKELSMVVRLAHYFFDNKPIIGKMIDFQLWDKFLSVDELSKYSACEKHVEKIGNVINPDTIPEITGSLIKPIEVLAEDTLCTRKRKRRTLHIHVPFLSFYDAQKACDKYSSGSIVGPFQDIEDWKDFYTIGNLNPVVLSECETGGRFLHWLGYRTDAVPPQAQDFTHVANNEVLAVNAWRPKQPNAKSGDQCLAAYLGLQFDKAWYDLACVQTNWQWAMCTGCWLPNSFQNFVEIKIRGLCSRSNFDNIYDVMNDPTGYVSYKGMRNTEVTYNPAERQWVMKLVNNPNVWAVSNASIDSLLMGRHMWTVYNDFYCQGDIGTTTLSFTTCAEDQFTCNNGLCVGILDRCNSQPDCYDLSDEFDCKIINPGQSYQNFIAPPPLKTENGEMDDKIMIDVSADIISILDIDEISSIFQVQFFLHFTWQDTRLMYYNLKNDTGLNTLSPEEKQQLWIPVLVFENTENKLSTVVDEDSTITISKRGNFTLSTMEDVENRQFFKGNENSITLSRFYNIRFLCNYEMQWYPFDVQSCTLKLSMKGKSSDFARLRADVLQYLGILEVNQYIVDYYKMSIEEELNKSSLEIEIILGRRLLTIILTTFVPTVLLNMISYSTNHFKAFFFEAIVTVNLTSMLVLTTLFINVSNSLPPTSYIKMIDVYLIFSLLIPFVEVLLHTYMDSLRLEGGDNVYDEPDHYNVKTMNGTKKDSSTRIINHHGTPVKVSADEKLNGFRKRKSALFFVPSLINQAFQSDSTDPHIPQVADVLKERKINPLDLVSRNETVEIEARENLYRGSDEEGYRLRLCKRFASQGIPLIFISFTICYWSIGMIHVYSLRNY